MTQPPPLQTGSYYLQLCLLILTNICTDSSNIIPQIINQLLLDYVYCTIEYHQSENLYVRLQEESKLRNIICSSLLCKNKTNLSCNRIDWLIETLKILTLCGLLHSPPLVYLFPTPLPPFFPLFYPMPNTHK
jgi:hypothetical protein